MRTNVKLPKFDTLVALYQKDPAAYEDFRKQFLNDEIAAASPQHHAALRHTLHRIEAARAQAKTPLEAAIAAYTLMCESTLHLRAELNNLHYFTCGLQASAIIESVRQDSRTGPKTRGLR
jgi:hypothetical protein